MCRLLAYKGKDISINKLLYEPKNSLIKQSFDARELEEPLNGDGFGVGWYAHQLSSEPVVFVSVYPAWNNRNLRSLAPKVTTGSFIAHVRAASVGNVSESNCHPFQYKNLLMAHNGGVEQFWKIKRKLRERLSDEFYNWIQGETDSEHIFALFLHHFMPKAQGEYTADDIKDALKQTLKDIEALMEECGIEEAAYLNLAVSDGVRIVALRYVTDPKVKPLTLYYSEGSKYECIEGACHMIPAKPGEHSVLIVSEKLTDYAEDWRMVPDNYFILVYKDLHVKLVAARDLA
ncbi:MAG: class II glutamine amidotransferase [Flavobacteriales bacterium]|nr:class II glutamine amidotransferase [Flavobacteriales bacterium]